jgi:hypothetical protein
MSSNAPNTEMPNTGPAVDQESARAAVQLAVLLVKWLTDGLLVKWLTDGTVQRC